MEKRTNHQTLNGEPKIGFFKSTAIVTALIILTRCSAIDSTVKSFKSIGEAEKPTVLLTYNDIAYRATYLLEDIDLKAEVLPRTKLPYSPNASATVIVGVDFPFDKAVQSILIGTNYYDDLRYILLSSDRHIQREQSILNNLKEWFKKYTLSRDEEKYRLKIHLGSSTDEALDLGLKAWKKEDLLKLKNVSSREELHTLIRSHYR